MEGDDSDWTGAVPFGLPGFAVVSAAELAGEAELLVETTAVKMGCPGCVVIATENCRRPAGRAHLAQTLVAVARDLQVGWHTVMRAVVAYGTPLIDDPNRLAGVDTLGVDEHVWVHTSATRRTGYATEGGDVRLRPGHLPSANIDRGPVRLSGLDCNGQSRLKLSPLPVAKTLVSPHGRTPQRLSS